MPKRSAGLIMYRRRDAGLEVFLVHLGGPFWASKDKGAWLIPKGEYAEGEQALETAQREFREETGFSVQWPYLELGTVRQAGGKIVAAWAFEGDCDPRDLISNTCQIEWPPRSGRQIEVPEIDRGCWFAISEAREHILKSQEPLLDALCRALHVEGN
jgi:predicted NUDIX family NTP pyrophosphohydrolase